MEQAFERGVLEKIWMIFGRDCRAMKRNCNCVTCRPFCSGLFLTAETKGKFTCRRSDFSIFHVAFLDLYFDSILANHVESFLGGYFISNMLSLMFWSVTCYAFTGPEGANWNRSERKVWKSFLLYILYNENSAELTRFCSTLANWKTFVAFLVFSKIFHPSHMKLCNFRTPFLSLIGRSRYCYAGSNVRNFGPGE